MNDMHGNSPKTLRQELLLQRKEFAAKHNYREKQDCLIGHLNDFLATRGQALRSIAAYWPIQNEVDLRPTLLAWANSDSSRQISLPYARPDKHLDFYQWAEGDILIPSQHGVPEPNPDNTSRPQATPDCILIPCVGWSSSMLNGKTHYWRLGYGGGYFDRTLAQLRKDQPQLICIGVGFDWQKLNDDQWAAQTHDEPLDLLLTETGLLG
jgi:5,10-methenyltetrahydrofolate synthetase